MSWICKECGGEIVEIVVVPMTIIRSIKKDGKTRKIILNTTKKSINKIGDFIKKGGYMCIDIDILKDDIKHCSDKIIELENKNECDECIESHKRLLNYMLFCKEKIENPIINNVNKCEYCSGWDSFTNRCMYFICTKNRL